MGAELHARLICGFTACLGSCWCVDLPISSVICVCGRHSINERYRTAMNCDVNEHMGNNDVVSYVNRWAIKSNLLHSYWREVRSPGLYQITPQPPRAYCEIPGYTWVRIRKEGVAIIVLWACCGRRATVSQPGLGRVFNLAVFFLSTSTYTQSKILTT